MASREKGGQERYSRQSLFWGIGERGQQRLGQSRVLVVGCGALGCSLVGMLARAGVGEITVVDRDFVELSNLQRQLLFDEADAREGLPKAVAAARAVYRINSEVTVHPLVADVTPANVEALVQAADLVLDGTDNFETRYILNDACVKLGVSWVYGGAVGSAGMSATIIPGETACFRCIFPESPPPGTMPTCETTGVLASIVAAVSAIEWTEAVKLLVGAREHLNPGLVVLDLWGNDYQQIERLQRRRECPCCGERRFEYLEARATSQTVSLCGRNAVQVSPARPRQLRLADLRDRLAPAGRVSGNDYLVRLVANEHEITIFSDGRAIIKGTTDETVARTLYARYVGV